MAGSGAAVDAQASLVEALRRRLGAELIETHISSVLLAGDYAYKIKKPVNLGFLDFSSLAARRHYCAEELRLNRRFAAPIYLEVVAVAGPPEAPALAAEATPGALEYAVKMRRFEQSALFDRMALCGELAPAHIDALAAALAAFHADAARAAPDDANGSAAAIEAPMLQNFAQLRPLLADSAAAVQALDAIEAWSRARHSALAPLYEARRRQGWVRECHGDLHLGNIAWVDGKALPFDGIEFAAALRWIDVMSEIAFLLMDLHWRQRPELAWRCLNAYLEKSGDYAGVALLDAYLVYRAVVRAKIAALQGDGPGLAGHLALAQRFMQRPQPCLLLTMGVSGSGKSRVARALAAAGGMLRLRSDVERKRLVGLDALAASGSSLNAGLYDEDMTRRTYAELARLARLVLAAGYPVVVDATCLARWQRDCLRAVARELALPCLTIACSADADILRQRVERRAGAGKDASEADLAVLEQQLAYLAEGAEVGADEALVQVDTGREEAEDAAVRLLRAIPNAACAPG